MIRHLTLKTGVTSPQVWDGEVRPSCPPDHVTAVGGGLYWLRTQVYYAGSFGLDGFEISTGFRLDVRHIS